MAEYEIHKGVGRGPEFKGLRGPYLFLFAGGLLFDVLLIVVCRLAGMSTAAYLTLGLAVGAGATALTFRLNAVYGEHGLMKRVARCRRPSRAARPVGQRHGGGQPAPHAGRRAARGAAAGAGGAGARHRPGLDGGRGRRVISRIRENP